MISLDRPIKAVAMDPDFYKPGRGKHFVTGDDKVIVDDYVVILKQNNYCVCIFCILYNNI